MVERRYLDDCGHSSGLFTTDDVVAVLLDWSTGMTMALEYVTPTPLNGGYQEQ